MKEKIVIIKHNVHAIKLAVTVMIHQMTIKFLEAVTRYGQRLQGVNPDDVKLTYG